MLSGADEMDFDIFFILNEQEREIVRLLRKGQFQALTITRNGRSYQVKLKNERRGNFTREQVIEAIESKAYQTVTIHRHDGKHIVLKQEESRKIE